MYLEPFSLPETCQGSKTLVLIQEIRRIDFVVVYNRGRRETMSKKWRRMFDHRGGEILYKQDSHRERQGGPPSCPWLFQYYRVQRVNDGQKSFFER